jgi:biotin transport system ATP-binding protein
MPSQSSPLIALDAVHYTPDGMPVLKGISLNTDARRIGVIGRNGSGKTSLARVLAGLVPTDGGQVRIAGVNVAQDRKAALRHVGILFQNPDHQIIFPTVEEEIAFGLLQLGQTKAEAAMGVAAVLAQFDKAHWAPAAIHQLSQGQRQLVCLMSVLAMRPQVIILDEPFAGLDIPTAIHLQRVLDGVDACLVVITHDPDVVRGYDQVIWLEGGEAAQQGAPSDVLPVFEARMKQIGAGDDLSYIAS